MEEHAKRVLDESVRDKGLRGIQGGGLIFSMTERESTRFDSKGFKEAHPEMQREYMKTNTSVVYEVKEGM